MGFCCIEYSVCDAVANQGLPYSLSLADAAGDGSGAIGILGGGCTQDYITIEGGSEVCGSPIFYSKFCGDVLSTYTAGTAPVPNNPICDCTPPFMVGIFTNAADADADADGAIEEDEDGGVGQSRGLCLNYSQKPC